MTIPIGTTYEFTAIPAGVAVLGLPGGSFVLSAALNATVGAKSLAWRLSNGVTGAKAFAVN